MAICRCHFACFKDDHDCIGARAFEVRVDEVRARAKIGLQNLVYNIRRLVTLERELFGEMPFFYHSVHLQLSTQWGEGTEELSQMCDYSLHTAKHRPAKVGDRLVTRNFNTGTRGFAAPEDARTAVCVLPGTELAFEKEVRSARIGLFGWKIKTIEHTTAIFRQVNKNEPRTHHDALEFPDGQIELLTDLAEGQEATVLQLPAQPATSAEAQAQEKVAYVG